MKLCAYISAWLALVALAAIYGFILGGTSIPGGGFYWDHATEDAVELGGFGLLAATLIVPGVFAVLRVRSGLSRGLGILLVAISSMLAAVLPPFIVASSVRGEAGMGVRVFFAPLCAVSGVLGFIILTFCVLFVRRKRSNAA